MFEKITPEQAGIESDAVIEFIRKLEKRHITTHSLLFMKGDKIFAEAYWKPFNKDFCHRQYSQTKSFVSIAIGLLQEDGKLSIEDKISDYFSDKIDGEPIRYLPDQTIKDMLKMTTVGYPLKWFIANDNDRTHLYFNNKRETRPSGTIWEYDSAGSQVLCSLVERLTGKTLLAFLKEKLFDKMGVFKTAMMLKTPNGDSWGDSAMICTLRDMAAFGRFVLNYGVWEGERLMNEKYLREATSKLVDNSMSSFYSAIYQGYGYQIWRVIGGGFAFVGMGDQLTVCYSEKDLIFACNSDNQGNPYAEETILNSLEEMFVNRIQKRSLPENKVAQKKLDLLISDLRLRSTKGMDDSKFRKELSATEYICEKNPMGIKNFSFIFKDKTHGEFRYTNEQGEKIIPFGVNYNVFGKFPQLGYSNEVGNVATTNGFMYNDAASLAWIDEKQILFFVQIIDKYFGNLDMKFAFKDNDVYAIFSANAEYFLTEYNGTLIGHKKR